MSGEDRVLKTFFAELANIGSVKDLPADQVDQILGKFRNVLTEMSEGLGNPIAAIPRESLLESLGLRQQQFKELLAQILGADWLSAKSPALIESGFEHPVRTKMVLRKRGNETSWQITSAELDDLSAAALLAVTRDQKCVFGICPGLSCRRIFPRSIRGRPQKYCSSACRGRSVPSAKKRSEYVSAYRVRKREEDLRRIHALLKRCNDRTDRYALLKRTFPGRPAKSILYVMRQVEKLLDAPPGRTGKARKRRATSPRRARGTARVRNGGR